MVFFAIAANEGGLFSSAARLAATAAGTLTVNCGEVGNDPVATAMITSAAPGNVLSKSNILILSPPRPSQTKA
jgi:hypothetical protein